MVTVGVKELTNCAVA